MKALSTAYKVKGDYPNTQKYLLEALQLAEETRRSRDKAEILKLLAELHGSLDEVEVARQYCQQALLLARELGIPLALEYEAFQLKIDDETLKKEVTIERGLNEPTR